MDVEANTLSAQLDSLRRERDRLEHLLMLDPNWRALKQLETRETSGEPVEAVDAAELKASLERALATNRIFLARAKLAETIDLLNGGGPLAAPVAEQPSLASRIVLLAPPAEPFRWRVRLKEQAAPPQADALELIDGFNRNAVEVLRDGGIATFAQVAGWTAADVETWQRRLAGLAEGAPMSWIEQAAMLATGRRTRYAARVRSGEFASLVAMPEPLPEPRAMVRPEPPRAEIVAVEPTPVAHVSTVVIVAPIAGPPSADVRPAGAPPLISAEELVRSLAKTNPPPPQAGPRRPYARPDGRALGAATSRPVSPRPTNEIRSADVAADSEVVVVSRNAASPDAGFATTPRPKPQRLLRRLKDVLEPDRFEADTYAAYRGNAEEASVTIIRAGEERKAAAQPAAEIAAASEPAGRSRFLRALTGDR